MPRGVRPSPKKKSSPFALPFPFEKPVPFPAPSPPRATDMLTVDVISFPSQPKTSFRFKITESQDHEKVKFWLEDRVTKQQWECSEKAMDDYVTAETTMPQATAKDYIACFRNCLEGSPTKSMGDCSADLIENDDKTVTLIFTLKVQVLTFSLNATYNFVLDAIAVDPVERLASKVRDQEEEIHQLEGKLDSLRLQVVELKQQNAKLQAKQQLGFMYFTAASACNTSSCQPVQWKATCPIVGAACMLQPNGSGLKFAQDGTYMINVGLRNNNNNNQLTFDLCLNGKPIQMCYDSSGSGHYHMSVLTHMVPIKANVDELSVVYRGNNQAETGSYLNVYRLNQPCLTQFD